jgi:hypothetical protein
MTRFPFPFRLKIVLCVLSALAISSGIKAQAQAAFKIKAGQAVSIVLPSQAIPSEGTAAQELQHYLAQITGATLHIVPENQAAALKGAAIYLGPTEFSRRHLKNKKPFGTEEWAMQTQGNALILTGGRPRGTLYAAYHFLEDVCGVRWWNPWEETVPRRGVLPITAMNKRGQPAFRYRDIYMIYGNDGGRFAARNRLNSTPTSAAYGGLSEVSLPSVHSFFTWLPPEKYFKDHPDWYLVPAGGAPTELNAQLCVSNGEMRAEFLKVLREKIRADREKALAENAPPPKLYDVSQMDNGIGFICGENKALVEKEGAESAALLDFINFLADGIKDEFPDVMIDTLAYHSGEKAPKTLRARDNVMIVLTDTQSNLLLPVTAERNRVMRENVEQWAKHCKYLRIWDYAITYVQPHIPTPTMHTYPTDLQFLLKHNGEGEFIEFEEPLQADMRDMKLWVLAKMLENPHQDYSALVREFTDGFYGPAGTYIRQYLAALETAAKASNADVDWFAATPQFKYLTLDFLQRADKTYDRAAAAVKDNAVFSRRVRDARSSLDNIILQRYSNLTQQWVFAGHAPDSMPINRDAIAKRYRQRWNEQIELRVAEAERAVEHQKADAAIESLIAGTAYVPLPAQFKEIPPQNLFQYSSRDARKDPSVKVVADQEAESGTAMRYEIPDSELEKYKMPMQWGIYDNKLAQRIAPPNLIQATDVPESGYHWYKAENVTLTSEAYVYFFWSWIIQSPVSDAYDATTPNAKYDVWISVKFSGPDFPHGKAEEKNAISIERIVLVKK